ncbi:MAG: hypothetical protein HY852_04660 [Bradyrhizobium sp.]|uniref:hypothetical protein n=1 Tax=Bradyrhizobium sp. TaxID=376 RepID=UPI0025BEB526|nr:hypothetical protein [Bradyrhizobium sp.]MBI5261092.1 hypothetical protein [Bradyrhizobium sp.]
MSSASEPPFPWRELAIAPTQDDTEIRRAYANRLKTIDPAADPAAFQALRRAYEAARGLASGRQEIDADGPDLQGADPPPDRTDVRRQAQPQLEALLAEVRQLALADNVAEAMAAIESFLGMGASSPNNSAHLQARLLSLVMDDPRMPGSMLAALADRFRWSEVGNVLEQFRPDLHERFLYRLTAAHEWLEFAREAARQQNGDGVIARFLLLPFSGKDDRALLGDFRPADVAGFLNGARRFAPLLGDTIDPRRIAFLYDIYKGSVTVPCKEQPVAAPPGQSRTKQAQAYVKQRFRSIAQGASIAIILAVAASAVLPRAVQYGRSLGLIGAPVAGTASPFPVAFATNGTGTRLVARVGRLFDWVTEIRYGVDRIIIGRDCAADTEAQVTRSIVKGRAEVELPRNTRFITMQFCYSNQVASDVFRFDVPSDAPDPNGIGHIGEGTKRNDTRGHR